MGDSAPRPRRPLIAAVAAACWLAAAGAAAEPYRPLTLENLTLEQAFERLESHGVTIVYSSDLVKPWMRVREEPAGQAPRAMLEAIVRPYALGVTEAANGALVIVRAEPAPAPATGGVTGRLRRAGDGEPLANVALRLGGGRYTARTDELGRFAFADLPPGRYRLAASGRSIVLAEDYVAEVRAGEQTSLELTSVDVRHSAIAEIVVNASKYEFVRDVAPPATSLSAAELETLPDLGDDPVRAVARLPGTARGDFSARANLRGGDSDETLVRFDGLRLYNPFHLKDFQGVFSTVNPAVIDGMDVYTGGFPARLGGRMSGVIEIAALAPGEDPYRELSLSFFSAGALAAGDFDAGDGDWLVAARRGNLDLILDALDPTLGEPSYADVHARLGHRLTDALAVSANLLRFDDDVALSDSDREEEATADYRDAYYWLRFDYQDSNALWGRWIVARSELDSHRRGRADQSGIARGFLDDRRSSTIDSLQTDWSWALSDRLLLQLGGEWARMRARYDYRDQVEFDLLFRTPGAPQTPGRERRLSAAPGGGSYGAYASLRVEAAPRLTFETGLRWDRETLSPEHSERWSPRASLLYRAGERTWLRASWGRYFQPQIVNELQIADGVTELFPGQRADHQVLSLEHRFANGIALRWEVYRKDYTSLRPRFENLLNTFILLPELKPDRIRVAPERARAQGMELSLRGGADAPLAWWLSYSYASIEDEIGGRELRRSWDQPHFLGGGAAWRGTRWTLSLAATLRTGWPTTAVKGIEPGATPLALTGPRNGARLGHYRALDVRIARRFELERAGSLSLFLELGNALDSKNACCVEYELEDEDGELTIDTERLDYLPFFPSIGVVWRF